MTTTLTPKAFSEKFNRLAEEIGCNARIQAGVRNCKFFRHHGYTGENETWFPIDAVAFDRMLDAHPALREVRK